MTQDMERIKKEIIAALSHPEAQDGLYFRNFIALHEEDERQAVQGDEIDVLDALRELIEQGEVVMDESGSEAVFQLSSGKSA
jgi:hypothetical protein